MARRLLRSAAPADVSPERLLVALQDEAVRAALRDLLALTVDAAVERLRQELQAGALDERLAEVARRTAPDPLHTPLVFGDPARLHVDPTADVNNALFNLSSGTVTVGEYAFFGHNVCLLTGTHDIAQRGRARMTGVPAEGRDIVVEPGAWLATNVTVQGPCRIGRDAVVAAGAVVVTDVPAGTVFGGIPARQLRQVPPAPAPPH